MILYAQSVRAVECSEAFSSLVIGFEKLEPVQKRHQVKKEAEAFASSCLNLIAKIKSSGILKSIHKDVEANRQQLLKDQEEFEGHTIPDPHVALPGNIFFLIL